MMSLLIICILEIKWAVNIKITGIGFWDFNAELFSLVSRRKSCERFGSFLAPIQGINSKFNLTISYFELSQLRVSTFFSFSKLRFLDCKRFKVTTLVWFDISGFFCFKIILKHSVMHPLSHQWLNLECFWTMIPSSVDDHILKRSVTFWLLQGKFPKFLATQCTQLRNITF